MPRLGQTKSFGHIVHSLHKSRTPFIAFLDLDVYDNLNAHA